MHTPPVPPAILIQTNIWINLVNLWHIWRHSGRTLPASFCLLLIYKVFEKGWPSWLVQFPATKGHLAAIENGGVNWSGLQTANRGNQHLQSFPKPKHTLQNFRKSALSVFSISRRRSMFCSLWIILSSSFYWSQEEESVLRSASLAPLTAQHLTIRSSRAFSCESIWTASAWATVRPF